MWGCIESQSIILFVGLSIFLTWVFNEISKPLTRRNLNRNHVKLEALGALLKAYSGLQGRWLGGVLLSFTDIPSGSSICGLHPVFNGHQNHDIKYLNEITPKTEYWVALLKRPCLL
jgi:hypothetical protein